MDNRIADANKKTQSAPLPEEVENLIWTFRCDLRRATPGDVSEMLLTLVNADDLHKAINLISDLTRRLAEVEAERDYAKMRGDNHAETLRGVRRMLSDVQPDTKRVLIWVSDGLFGYSEPLEATLLKANDERNDANTRAEAAERELEELKRSTK